MRSSFIRNQVQVTHLVLNWNKTSLSKKPADSAEKKKKITNQLNPKHFKINLNLGNSQF